MDDLKPCPFCGSDPMPEFYSSEDGAGYAIHCQAEACPAWPSAYGMDEAEAITAWNTRASDPRLAEVEVERDEMRAHLAWYVDTFCEKGPYSEVCGKLSPDECSGCRARAALGAKP